MINPLLPEPSNYLFNQKKIIFVEKVIGAVVLLKDCVIADTQFQLLWLNFMNDLFHKAREVLASDNPNDFNGSFYNFFDRITAELAIPHPQHFQKALIQAKDSLLEIRIEHPQFIIPRTVVTKADAKWQPINRICFRGDGRDPETIFSQGFFPRNPDFALMVESVLNSSEGNVIAFSSRFRAATFFPFDENIQNSWVYVFKARHGFDVHHHGYSIFAETGIPEAEASALFVDELITDKIPSEDIIAAVNISRSAFDESKHQIPFFLKQDSAPLSPWHKKVFDFLMRRGIYSIRGFQMNPACGLTQEEKNLAATFVMQEINANPKNIPDTSQLPTPLTGYSRNCFFESQRKTIQPAKERPSTPRHRIRKFFT